MVVTTDEECAEKLVILRVHGSRQKYYNKVVGGNFRLDLLQAVVVTVKLPQLDGWTAGRQVNAARYKRLFAGAGLVKEGSVSLAQVVTDRHVFNWFIIRVIRRDEFVECFRKKDIACNIYYPLSLHPQECFASLDHKEGDSPKSEKAAQGTLALPVYPELTDEMAQCVVDTIAEFLKGGS
jgi:dTDP-4-amino-4,6-dideoxygalactose transaminase